MHPFARNRERNITFRRELPGVVLEYSHNAFPVNAVVLASYLGAEEVKAYVPNDFVEAPAATVRSLKVVAKGDVVAWIEHFVDVSFAFAVVAIFGESIHGNVEQVEVPEAHECDTQREQAQFTRESFRSPERVRGNTALKTRQQTPEPFLNSTNQFQVSFFQ